MIVERLDCTFTTVIHPTAIISPTAIIGEGTVVMQGAIVQTEVKIGKHCIINTKASIDHECVISDYVHISPGCTISGDVCGRRNLGWGWLNRYSRCQDRWKLFYWCWQCDC